MQRFDLNGPRICKKKAVKKRYAKGGSVRSGSDPVSYTHLEQVKSSLKFSVFSFTAVKSEKCDICQTT